MWVQEYVFSEGDLSKGIKGEEYSVFLSQYYNNDIIERYEHVVKMIERLESEKLMLSDYLPF